MTENRKGERIMKGTMFRIDADIHKQLRIAAIEEGISMQEALTRAVVAWLKEHRRKEVKK
jgi:hypothetical protein